MKAIVQDSYGPVGALELRDVDRPVPRDDEVLLQVYAAGVDPGVWHLMEGRPYLIRLGVGFGKPKNPVRGWDVAGRVAEVGAKVQLAASYGAVVTGVCGPEKAGLVRSLGASDVIDYTREDVTARGEPYDVILDMAGNRPLSVLRRALAPRGILVMGGGENGGSVLGGMERQLVAAAIAPFTGQKFRGIFAATRRDDLVALAKLTDDGRLTPALDRTFPLEQAPDAIRYVREGKARGKVVVTVRPEDDGAGGRRVRARAGGRTGRASTPAG